MRTLAIAVAWALLVGSASAEPLRVKSALNAVHAVMSQNVHAQKRMRNAYYNKKGMGFAGLSNEAQAKVKRQLSSETFARAQRLTRIGGIFKKLTVAAGVAALAPFLPAGLVEAIGATKPAMMVTGLLGMGAAAALGTVAHRLRRSPGEYAEVFYRVREIEAAAAAARYGSESAPGVTSGERTALKSALRTLVGELHRP